MTASLLTTYLDTEDTDNAEKTDLFRVFRAVRVQFTSSRFVG